MCLESDIQSHVNGVDNNLPLSCINKATNLELVAEMIEYSNRMKVKMFDEIGFNANRVGKHDYKRTSN